MKSNLILTTFTCILTLLYLPLLEARPKNKQKVIAVPLEKTQGVSLKLYGEARASFNASPGAFTKFQSEIMIPQNIHLDIKKGQRIKMELPISIKSDSVYATISNVQDHSFIVSFLFPARTIEGMNISTKIPLKNDHLYKLPIDSIVSPLGTTQYAFLVNNTQAFKKKLHIIQLSGTNLIVRFDENIDWQSELAIVTAGQYSLMDGDLVEVVK